MEHPYNIVRRICEQKGVKPGELLLPLMQTLTESHGLHSVQGFARGANSEANVLNEIQANMQFMQRKEFPTSLLTTLQMMMETTHLLDSSNVNVEGMDETQRGYLKQKIKAEETLILVLRELANQSEAQSMRAQLWLEEEIKAGRIKPQKQQEEGPQAEDASGEAQ